MAAEKYPHSASAGGTKPMYDERRRYQWDARIRRGDESLTLLAALKKECAIEGAKMWEEAKAKAYPLLHGVYSHGI